MFKFKIFLVCFSFIFAGCVKERTIEKTITPERQAAANLNKSVKINTENKNQIVLSKASLGKAFILIPTLKSTGRNPDVNFLSPLIISFEKSGNKIALLNLTELQLYNTIKSDRLLQTFNVISEDDNSIVIDMDKGFTSFNVNSSIGIMFKGSVNELQKKIQSGTESSVNVKESFVKNITTDNNSIYFEQAMRIKSEQIEDKVDPMEAASTKDAKPKPTLVISEVTANLIFEMKPYIQNSRFQSKIFDKEQRFGFFLNFSLAAQQDEAIPQITKWDISESSGPITVRLHQDTPKNVRSAMNEGILYWNKAFGQNILQIGLDFNSAENQADRTIHVYWIPWDSAGFARAGFQADPITGEIFRGQVFMTSSWYLSTKDSFKVFDSKQNLSKNSLIGSCVLDQSKVFSKELINLENPKQSEKVSLDTVRVVLAHEVGHALGLRHNFAGSSTTKINDDEIESNRKKYILGEKNSEHRTSTTVMDYTLGIDTGINGQHIKDHVMTYDKAAIAWGYLDQNESIEKYQYCSDEHIMMANYAQKQIYGCERFDANTNLIKFGFDSVKRNTEYRAAQAFLSFLNQVRANKSYYSKEKSFEDLLSTINLGLSTPDSTQFDSHLFSKEDFNKSFFSISTIIDSTFDNIRGGYIGYESKISQTIKEHSKQVGGYSGILSGLLEVKQNDPLYFQNQVIQFFEKLDFENFKEVLTLQQIDLIKNKMIEQAKLADQDYELSLVQSYPYVKKLYVQDPTTKEYKPVDQKMNPEISLGDFKVLSEIYIQAYKKYLRKSARTVYINQISYELKLMDTYAYQNIGDITRKLFLPANLYSFSGVDSGPIALQDLTKQFKLLAVQNTLEILKIMQVSGSDTLTSENLKSLIDKIDWTKIVGLTSSDLMTEITELKKWEDNK